MQHRALYMKAYLSFIFFGDINLPEKHCCVTLNILVQLTMRSSTKHTERIAAFPLQQQLHEGTTMLPCTNTAYLVTLSDVRTTHTIFRLVFYITEIIQPKKFRKRSLYISASTNHGMKNKSTEIGSTDCRKEICLLLQSSTSVAVHTRHTACVRAGWCVQHFHTSRNIGRGINNICTANQ
jgi:hypothetical protein